MKKRVIGYPVIAVGLALLLSSGLLARCAFAYPPTTIRLWNGSPWPVTVTHTAYGRTDSIRCTQGCAGYSVADVGSTVILSWRGRIVARFTASANEDNYIHRFFDDGRYRKVRDYD